MPKPSIPRGVQERREAGGRVRYRVQVRRNGQAFTATLPSLDGALAWRAQALAAAEGRAEAPTPPRVAASTVASGRAATIEDAARRLCRGMLDGSIRTRDGLAYKRSVAEKYERYLRLLVVPRIGAVPIAALGGGDVQRLVDEIAAETTPEHARKALTALRVALRVAIRYGELQANPCTGTRVPTSAEPEKPARILTPEEAATIIKACDADDARLERSLAGPFYRLAFGCGLRLGELLALQWGPEGLDLDAGVVHVRAALDRVRDGHGEFPRIAPKSRASRRDVPIPPDELAVLRRHRLTTGRPEEGAYVFPGTDGHAPSPIPVFRAFKRACRVAGVAEPLPRPHDVRHAFATHALAAGLSAHAVAELLGHKDAGLVWRRYGHALPDEVAGAGTALSAWRRARGV